ncbi:MAG: DNA primase [Ruminococcaceae bacterium]|nr:DNA primase [Oscillospiraceae bacterium]
MAIPREVIEEILYRTDIEELVGSYVTLKRAGSNLTGLCPFHSEKTPSFSVSPAKKFFYCFGCGAGGDAITFVMKAENLDYPQAVAFLAKRAGIKIPENGRREDGMSRERVFAMNLEAAKFFRKCLFDPKYGQEGMEYLRGARRLSTDVIRRFGLGFSPNTFGMLTDHMHKCGYRDEELIAGFLCGKSQKTGRSYDYFRNRVMFPIIDVSGNVIAFGGRVMDDSKPKYLNSSDTPGFKKSKNLFALNYAKNNCAEQMILCEGYMDVIAMHAAGFENAVATLGTSLTSEQARLMTKYTKKVIISYDSDEAGQRAADRAIRLLGEVGLDVRILRLTGAKDPDEYIKLYGADRLRALLGQSKTWFDFKWNAIASKYNLETPSDRIKASEEACAIIAGVGSSIEREVYISQIATPLGLPGDVIKSNVEREIGKRRAEAKRKEGQDAKLSIRNYGDRTNPDAAKNIAANAAEEAILGMLLLYEEHRSAVLSGKVALSEEDFCTSLGKRIFEALMRLQVSEGGFLFSLLGEDFTPDEMGRMQKYMQTRAQLTENGPEVLARSVEALKRASQKAAESAGNISDLIQKKRNQSKQKD